MPIIIHQDLPAYKILGEENIFVMNPTRANAQDIRELEIAILNLMPLKIETETQILRLLSNTSLQIKITFLSPKDHVSKNTCKTHLDKFYKKFDTIKNKKFDGFIITGAPIEKLEFEQVNYYDEMTQILDYLKTNVTSSIFICWSSQLALYHFYNIKKYIKKMKISGIYSHNKHAINDPLFQGVDDKFYIPQSRFSYNKHSDIVSRQELQVLAYNKQVGASIIKSKDNKFFFMSGHLEYGKDVLHNEYLRDKNLNENVNIPYNYYDSHQNIKCNWSSSANLIFANWLNYYVYQVTPYNLN